MTRLPERVNRGVGVVSRQAMAEAQAIAKKQLENRHWLLIFENRSVGIVWALSSTVCLDIGDRLEINVSARFPCHKVNCFQ